MQQQRQVQQQRQEQQRWGLMGAEDQKSAASGRRRMLGLLASGAAAVAAGSARAGAETLGGTADRGMVMPPVPAADSAPEEHQWNGHGRLLQWGVGYNGEAFAFMHNGTPFCVNADRLGGRLCQDRWHTKSPIAFEKSLRVTMEHGHANHRSDDLFTTAYWYQTEPHAVFPPLPAPASRVPRVFRVGGASAREPGE